MTSNKYIKMYDLNEDNQLTLFDSNSIEFIKKIKTLPKIELHRHLTGSLTTSSTIKIALKYNVKLPTYIESELDEKLSINYCNGDLKKYFQSWEILNQLFIHPDAIYDITRDAIHDAYLDNISYLELRLAPRWFLRSEKYRFPDLINAFKYAALDSYKDLGIITRGIIGIPRHIFINFHTDKRIKMFYSIIYDIKKYGDRIFVGIDLNGDELFSNGSQFKYFFDIGHKNELKITIHAGEIGPAENVRYAIEALNAKRIGHGIASLKDDKLISLARDKNIVFEFCPTSNQLLGLYELYEQLPLRSLLNRGLKFAICTDNPARCKINLSEELLKIMRHFNFNFDEIVRMEEIKINSIFEDDEIKKILFQKLLSNK